MFFEKYLKHKLTKNMMYLYGAHVARYLFPLVTLPYLTRVLGTKTWGVVAFIQAYSLYIAMVIEFGVGISGTREISVNRGSMSKCGEILYGILGAQFLLISISISITFLIQRYITIFITHPFVLWMGTFSAVFQGLALLWYFQGLPFFLFEKSNPGELLYYRVLF